jgi:hypothetical protein
LTKEFGLTVVRCAAALALVSVQFSCASAQKPAEAAAQGSEPDRAMTIADASTACANVQQNPDVPVSCTAEYIDDVPSIIVGFRNPDEAREWLGPFVDQVGAPFCDAANRSGREARVYMTVGTGADERARRWSCELAKWGAWFQPAREAAAAAPPQASPPARTSPATRKSAPPATLDDAVRACKLVQANRNVPVSCKTDTVNGVPSLIVGFPSAEEANAYMEQVAQKVAQPFCDAANRAGQRASFYVTLAAAQARHYDCEQQRWSDWFELPQRAEPARTAI